MTKADDIRVRIAEVDDEIRDLENEMVHLKRIRGEQEKGMQSIADDMQKQIDNLRCKRADLEVELSDTE